MRGRTRATGGLLPHDDLHELVDLLAVRLFHDFGYRVGSLSRQDIAELIHRYINDLHEEDQKAIPWLVWNLIQEGFEG